MNVYEAIATRKSVRAFQDKDVPQETLMRILQAARLAPSASNRQEWRFVVVRNPETRKKLVPAAMGQSFVGQAPVVLVCCAETDQHQMPCQLPCYPIDLAIAIDHITLCAVEEGLGTCWIGAFKEDLVKEALGIPETIKVVQLLPLGYLATPGTVAKDRLPIEKIVRYESWGFGA